MVDGGAEPGRRTIFADFALNALKSQDILYRECVEVCSPICRPASLELIDGAVKRDWVFDGCRDGASSGTRELRRHQYASQAYSNMMII